MCTYTKRSARRIRIIGGNRMDRIDVVGQSSGSSRLGGQSSRPITQSRMHTQQPARRRPGPRLGTPLSRSPTPKGTNLKRRWVGNSRSSISLLGHVASTQRDRLQCGYYAYCTQRGRRFASFSTFRLEKEMSNGMSQVENAELP